jgi:hypothetical protein
MNQDPDDIILHVKRDDDDADKTGKDSNSDQTKKGKNIKKKDVPDQPDPAKTGTEPAPDKTE